MESTHALSVARKLCAGKLLESGIASAAASVWLVEHMCTAQLLLLVSAVKCDVSER